MPVLGIVRQFCIGANRHCPIDRRSFILLPFEIEPPIVQVEETSEMADGIKRRAR